MNILFLTLLDFNSLDEHNIYADLLREFTRHNHKVFVISPVERRKKQSSHIIKTDNSVILKLKIGNTQKTNFVEKGISTLLIELLFSRGIKKYFSEEKIDFVMYSTPPVTFYRALAYVKKRDNAKTCLLLKDIFPQNAVDLGILVKTGIKGIIYRYFRNKEKKLYEISDCIGCMSPANRDYVIAHNPEVDCNKVKLLPNSIEVSTVDTTSESKKVIRKKYGIPSDTTVFVYGGNLGKPQGIEFLIRCLKTQGGKQEVFFLVIGEGTDYRKLEAYIRHDKPRNVKLMKSLPKEDYDQLVRSCDVGMIFLDNRFTIPNFPSRLLSYMEANIPVLAVTDINTDVGKVIITGRFGWWCRSNDERGFSDCVEEILNSNIKDMGINGRKYLMDNYTVEHSYDMIMKTMKGQDLKEED